MEPVARSLGQGGTLGPFSALTCDFLEFGIRELTYRALFS